MFFRGGRNLNVSTNLVANSNLNTSCYLRVPFGGYRFQIWGVVEEAGGAAAATALPATPGQNEFVCPGSYTWVAPTNVCCVSAVAIGAGGAGSCQYYGGAGGGLAYSYCVPVTPGTTYTVCVGSPGVWCNGNYQRGGCSFFKDASTVMATGGGTDSACCLTWTAFGCGVAGNFKSCGGCGSPYTYWDYKFYTTYPTGGGAGPHFFCPANPNSLGAEPYTPACYQMNTGGPGTGIWFGRTAAGGSLSCNGCRLWGGACCCSCQSGTCGWLWHMTENCMPSRLVGATGIIGGCCGMCYFSWGCPYSGGGWGQDLKGCWYMSGVYGVPPCAGGGNGGQFGGGGGGKHAYGCYCSDNYSPGLGGGGAVRIIWGDMVSTCRMYPCCNTLDI